MYIVQNKEIVIMIKAIQTTDVESTNGVRGIRASEAKEISAEKDNSTNLLGKTSTEANVSDYANAIKTANANQANQANDTDPELQKKAEKYLNDNYVRHNKCPELGDIEDLFKNRLALKLFDPRKYDDGFHTTIEVTPNPNNKDSTIELKIDITVGKNEQGQDVAVILLTKTVKYKGSLSGGTSHTGSECTVLPPAK